MIFHGDGIKQGRCAGRLHHACQCSSQCNVTKIGHSRGRSMRTGTDNMGKSHDRHQGFAIIKPQVVRMNERALVTEGFQALGQGVRAFTPCGQERIIMPEAQCLFVLPEQHAIFGTHGIGPEPADI